MGKLSLAAREGDSMILKTDTLESIRPLSPDERRAIWAAAFYGAGWHRTLQDASQGVSTILGHQLALKPTMGS